MVTFLFLEEYVINEAFEEFLYLLIIRFTLIEQIFVRKRHHPVTNFLKLSIILTENVYWEEMYKLSFFQYTINQSRN